MKKIKILSVILSATLLASGENWFVYFRAYSPTKAFVEQKAETIIPNFVEVK